MMNLLERYIAKTIILATALTTLLVSGVLLLLTLLTQLKNIGDGDYGMLQAIYYILLRLPNELYQFSPLLILLGSIIGLSILSLHHELTVMRSSGFTTRRIIFSVLSAALGLIILLSLFGEYLGPSLSYKAEVNKENARNAGSAVVTATGVWFHIDNNFIHVKNMVGRHLLEGVMRYQFDDQHHLEAAYFAKSLSYENDTWQMNDVVKTSFYPERTTSQFAATMPWSLKLNPNLFNLGLVDPNEMTLSKLSKFSNYLKSNGLSSAEYTYDYWRRIFQPISSVVMIFLAIPFVLGKLRTSSLGSRIIVGIMMGFGFFIVNALLGRLCVVFQIPTVAAALLPPLLFATIGFILSNKLLKF